MVSLTADIATPVTTWMESAMKELAELWCANVQTESEDPYPSVLHTEQRTASAAALVITYSAHQKSDSVTVANDMIVSVRMDLTGRYPSVQDINHQTA